MSSSLSQLLEQLHQNPSLVAFSTVIDVINEHYDFTATRLVNGIADDVVISEKGENEGSCRIFAFAQLHKLSQEQTLHCFGDYYRQDVLGHPNAQDHGNIRTFIRHGWKGIQLDTLPLTLKR